MDIGLVDIESPCVVGQLTERSCSESHTLQINIHGKVPLSRFVISSLCPLCCPRYVVSNPENLASTQGYICGKTMPRHEPS